jgi:hypothetical protein
LHHCLAIHSYSLYNVLTWVALFSLHFIPRYRLDRLLSSIFSWKKIICREIIQELLCLYAPRACMNTWIHLGMMFMIYSSICMCKLKYIRSFITVLFIYEGRHVRIYVLQFLYYFSTYNFFPGKNTWQQSIYFDFWNLSSSGGIVYKERWWHWHKLVTDLFYDFVGILLV